MWLNLTTWQAKPALSIKSNVERIEAVKYIDICQVEMFLLSVSFLMACLDGGRKKGEWRGVE